jgi:hypothetical protein
MIVCGGVVGCAALAPPGYPEAGHTARDPGEPGESQTDPTEDPDQGLHLNPVGSRAAECFWHRRRIDIYADDAQALDEVDSVAGLKAAQRPLRYTPPCCVPTGDGPGTEGNRIWLWTLDRPLALRGEGPAGNAAVRRSTLFVSELWRPLASNHFRHAMPRHPSTAV